ncbi:nicotinamide N-methyltransferase-like isoform X2 [Eleutherodactylus coqui]|uniref:nicotinamide N-methyltransferase-like isoform X2 n=1 Tax=Eleutherodactylus coqui TaxID=57060 RepID=UPI0034631CB8
MASSTLKHYYDEEFDPKLLDETHFSHGNIPIIEENVVYPVRILHELFCSGKVKGDTLLDVSIGGSVYQLMSASNCFKEIYVMNFTDCNINHFKKWLETEEDATDWSFVFKKVCEFEGNSDKWQEKEEQVKKAIKRVIKWENFENSAVKPQLLPTVDCVLSLWQLDGVSKTKEEYQSNMKKFTCSLRPGGQLILFSAVNMSHYMVGKHKFFILPLERDFIRESVTNAGFDIEKEDYLSRKVITDIVDYDGLLCILARKQSECPI